MQLRVLETIIYPKQLISRLNLQKTMLIIILWQLRQKGIHLFQAKHRFLYKKK